MTFPFLTRIIIIMKKRKKFRKKLVADLMTRDSSKDQIKVGVVSVWCVVCKAAYVKDVYTGWGRDEEKERGLNYEGNTYDENSKGNPNWNSAIFWSSSRVAEWLPDPTENQAMSAPNKYKYGRKKKRKKKDRKISERERTKITIFCDNSFFSSFP